MIKRFTWARVAVVAPGTRSAAATQNARVATRRIPVAPYLLVLPGLLLLGIWAYYPLLDTIGISFFSGTLVGGMKEFIGFQNYAQVVRTPEFQRSLLNTIYYIAGMIPLAVILPLGAALLAADVGDKMRNVYRSIMFTPMIMAPVVVSLIWLWILNPLQGMLNALLHNWFGLPMVNWLGSESTAIWTIIFITGWKILGFSFILYAAAIAGIERSYIDAARIDGANHWQVIFRIILPLLTPTFYFLLLFTMLFAGQWAFAPINVLTQGQPNNSTSNVFYEMYLIAFQYFNVGQSAAASVLVFGAMGLAIVSGLWIVDKRSHYDD